MVPQKSERLDVVDALRGFALMAIVLLHSMEHYNLFHSPLWQPAWLTNLDSHITDVIWFLLAGKAYATFSLLFGFSFYIQMRNARRRGVDFRARFAWRMLLLALFAQIHALFYNGDILLFYAVCGLILIPASSWSNRTVLIVAILLLLQPIDWIHMLIAHFNPEYIDTNSRFAVFAASAENVAANGNLCQTLINNISNGQLYSNFWQIEAGRICQTPALFLLGMWLGRNDLFKYSAHSQKFWTRVLLVSIAIFGPLYIIKEMIPAYLTHITWISHFGIALGLPVNFCIMCILVSVFVLCWFNAGNGLRWQKITINYGRMSLTNYITQSIIGVTLFYNFGAGLFRYCGGTLSLLIGLGIVIIQIWWSGLWLRHHRQGPLEWLWKRLTWIKSTH